MTPLYIKFHVGNFECLWVAAITDAPSTLEFPCTLDLKLIREDGKDYRLIAIRSTDLSTVRDSIFKKGFRLLVEDFVEEYTCLEEVTNILLTKLGFFK